VPFCPPHISHGLTWDGSRGSAVISYRTVTTLQSVNAKEGNSRRLRPILNTQMHSGGRTQKFCISNQVVHKLKTEREVISHHSRIFYQGADKSLTRPTSRCILFDGENISFDVSLVMYINSTNILPIIIINRIFFFL
jgi:hypothetical protein